MNKAAGPANTMFLSRLADRLDALQKELHVFRPWKSRGNWPMWAVMYDTAAHPASAGDRDFPMPCFLRQISMRGCGIPTSKTGPERDCGQRAWPGTHKFIAGAHCALPRFDANRRVSGRAGGINYQPGPGVHQYSAAALRDCARRRDRPQHECHATASSACVRAENSCAMSASAVGGAGGLLFGILLLSWILKPVRRLTWRHPNSRPRAFGSARRIWVRKGRNPTS